MTLDAIRQTIGSGLNQIADFNINHPTINATIHLGLVAYGAFQGDSYYDMGKYAILTHFGTVAGEIGLTVLGSMMTPPAVIPGAHVPIAPVVDLTPCGGEE